MKKMIFILLIINLYIGNAWASGPHCVDLFADLNINKKVSELEKILGRLNLKARLLLDLYQFRTESDYGLINSIPYGHMGSSTIGLRKLSKAKNILFKEIPHENEAFHRLSDIDKALDFKAKYLGRIIALTIFLRSELGLMPEDIARSDHMTPSGEFSIEPTPHYREQKNTYSKTLKDMLAELNRLPEDEVLALFRENANRSNLLTTLKSDGDALIRRLMFRFHLSEENITVLLKGWSKIHSRKAKYLDEKYLSRSEGYRWWPL